MKQTIVLAAALLSTLLLGCAPAYHDYPCGCIPFDYCPPPPLPVRRSEELRVES